MLRWLTAGESHGPELVAILEGLPAGVPVTLDGIREDLQRRKLGYGRGSRQKFEQDELNLSGGVVHGRSIGGPVALRIGNTEWPKWVEVMNPEPVELTERSRGRGAALTRPRPGHADLVGMQKYDFDEARPVLERASARETAARVALGAVARAFLEELGIRLISHTLSIGPVRVPEGTPLPRPSDLATVDEDPLRCFDPATSALMVAEVDDAKREGTPSAASSRCSPTGCRPGSAPTCTGTGASMRSSPRRSWASRRSRRSRWVTGSPPPRAAAPPPTTSSCRDRTESSGSATGRAAPRAA
ncbi:hypothetical protein GCM10025866_28650 [Naasia aerilata]|uniref:chorismate synthase n=1 Tax=Naasia aerilata TaxID=1162966 RepID=A0ABM8GF67_9MICO|nr:hypothetical protein GCM10025866_28650 [Naasia aerilata]